MEKKAEAKKHAWILNGKGFHVFYFCCSFPGTSYQNGITKDQKIPPGRCVGYLSAGKSQKTNIRELFTHMFFNMYT